MTEEALAGHFAPDMAVIGMRLSLASIVLLSWFVSEYDGLGFVKSEKILPKTSDEISGETLLSGKKGIVSLFYPEEKRHDVLELLGSLRDEGMEIEILFDAPPSVSSHAVEDDSEEACTLEDFDTI